MTLERDIQKFTNQLEKDLTKAKRTAARIALKKLLYRSPARTGNYMRSHKVGIAKTDTGRGIGKGAENKLTPEMRKEIEAGGGFHPPMSQGEKLALAAELYQKRSAYISRFQFDDDITIYNNIFYADRVEHKGWADLFPMAKVHTPPYKVYSLTVAELQILMPLLPKIMVKGSRYDI